MAIGKLPETPGPGPSAEQIINTGISEAQSIQDVGPAVLRTVRGLSVIAGRSYPGAEGAAEVSLAEDAAGSIVDFAMLPIIGIMLFGIILAYWIVQFERLVLSKVPIVGNNLKHLTDGQISVLQPVVGWLAGQATQAMSGIMQGLISAVHWTLFQGQGPVQNIQSAAIQQAVLPVKREVDHLWGWVNQISNAVVHLNAEVQAHPASVGAGYVTLADQVHALQERATRIEHAITGIHTDIATLNGRIEAVQDLFEQLAAHVVGVRAVNVGWQDVMSQIATLQADVASIQRDTVIRVDGLTTNVSHLLPLGILLEAGAQGLANLRTLEDNICQCPRMPGVINELGLAMSTLHHLKGD